MREIVKVTDNQILCKFYFCFIRMKTKMERRKEREGRGSVLTPSLMGGKRIPKCEKEIYRIHLA